MRISTMNEARYIPQVETDEVSRSAQRARYNAYMQGLHKLKMKAKSDKASRDKAARIGGAA
ncbi:MAG: hypothetical protein K6E53_13795 [Lachnospiraceae bacterium]|nr:hypothetical protein [Lachnospiraceae bacterium]